MVHRPANEVSRRAMLLSGSVGAFLVPASGSFTGRANASPLLMRKAPTLTHGIATGDAWRDGVLVWARSDKPARMIVQTSPTKDFSRGRTYFGPQLLPEDDGTGHFRLCGLEPGRQYNYRVILEGENGAQGRPLDGVFTTAPVAAKDISFIWSGDVVGQGWGRNTDLGGMTVWSTMADREPDFFIHSGDAIYADNPVQATQQTNDGRVYRNVTAPGKDQVAQSIDQFRGNYRYNLEDEHYLRFNREVTQIIQWDDHETLNNWYPGESLVGQNRKGYTDMNVNRLASHAFKAWHEYQPIKTSEAVDGRVYRKLSYGPLLDVFMLDMRSYKDPNPGDWTTIDAGGILGAKQTNWLIRGLQKSTATWKVVANDLPWGIVVPDPLSDPKNGPPSMEATSQGDPGRPLGREIEFARILACTKNVPNIVYITADVHYTAALHYHPDRAAFKNFSPFWEFVSGPLNAGAFPANPVDATFGPEQVYVHAPTEPNVSPLEGFQHFGEVTINKTTKAMTVNLCDSNGQSLWRKRIDPE